MDEAVNRFSLHFEELYHEYFVLLVRMAVRKFNIPTSEAETLAHEVFLSYWIRGNDVRDVHAWMVGAICHASRYYQRANDTPVEPLTEGLELRQIDPASIAIFDRLPNQLAARQALDCLSPRDQQVLRLRYLEGCSITELAERLGTTTGYAEKLVMKSLRAAAQLYTKLGRDPRMFRRPGRLRKTRGALT